MEQFLTFLKDAQDLGKNIKLEDYDRIIAAGMGGSGNVAELLKIFVKDKPIEILKNSSIPNYENNKTLLMIFTYSGNTEEMNSLYYEGKRKNCQIVVITSGGKIRDKCIKEKDSYVKIPSGLKPRDALPLMLMPALNILQIKEFDIPNLIKALKIDSFKQRAKDLAQNFIDTIPIIYSSQKMYPVAYRWKTMINENAQVHAMSNEIPEMCHNEIEAFVNLKADHYVCIIRDEQDSLRIKQRMDLLKEILKEKGIPVTEIAISGKNLFNRVMIEVYLGDWTSKIMAKLYERNDEDLVEDFKKRL